MVQRLTEFDTIAAISTPLGEGGISIVRVSGEDAVEIANKVFKGKDLTQVASHTINYGHIVDPASGQVIDEVMASVMLAPKTFTKEDTVEINCHGGIVVTNDILQLLLANGARMADPGEFTKRAFVNGRIDLTQAESVMDIIRAKTDKARQVAVKQLEGGLLTEIRALRQEILDVLANVEVNIDYPEYDEEEVTGQKMLGCVHSVGEKIDKLLETAQEGQILRNGLKTAIVGRPNVGKSSLLNYLTQSDKAIVMDVAGTTRDTQIGIAAGDVTKVIVSPAAWPATWPEAGMVRYGAPPAYVAGLAGAASAVVGQLTSPRCAASSIHSRL